MTEAAYREALIKEGVSRPDAERAAAIFYRVDGKRRRTEEEQTFISSIWQQVVGEGDRPKTLTRGHQ